MNRRSFLSTLGGAAALAAPVKAQTPAVPLKLGIDTYSLRAFKWTVDQMLDYAELHKLDAIQASRGDFENYEAPYLTRVKERAAKLGILLEPGWGCISPVSKGWNKNQGTPTAYLLEGIRVSRILGARSFRVFVGGAGDRQGGVSIPNLMESAITGLKSVRSQALDAQVKIAIENHGDFQARQVKTIIEEAGKDYVASCLDTGNPVNVIEDPLLTLEILGPYVVSTHIRDSVVFEHPRGAAVQWVALGDGSIDFVKLTERFREVCPRAPFLMEVITGRPPQVVPYLEPAFWKNFAGTPAEEFARFVGLAKKGHPLMGATILSDVAGAKFPPEYAPALKAQQRYDLDRSLDYAKHKLNTGTRWRA
jgi:3-oxoisoapionate decarboxylase